jgi:hypothetical protein
MENGKWRIENGGLRIENGGSRMEDRGSWLINCSNKKLRSSDIILARNDKIPMNRVAVTLS